MSFPIQCMSNRSNLQNTNSVHSTMPIYMNYANSCTDPLERMKAVIAAQMSYPLYNDDYEKPLNPLLGETTQYIGQDGAMIYME